MNQNRITKVAAGAACIVSIGMGALFSAGAAHADGAKRPLCIFVAASGTAKDDISQLKCVQNDNVGFAFWLYGGTSLDFYGTPIAGYADSTTTGDKWYYDPAVVSFSDIKKELQREYGYTNVTYGGHESGITGDAINANYDRPSKSKH